MENKDEKKPSQIKEGIPPAREELSPHCSICGMCESYVFEKWKTGFIHYSSRYFCIWCYCAKYVPGPNLPIILPSDGGD